VVHDFLPTKYRLKSFSNENTFPDDGWLLDAPGEKDPCLIRAIYASKQLSLRREGYGLYTFADWLPVYRILEGSSAPVTYRSEGLAKKLGLHDLYITFSGFWPEKGAFMKTGSFKETEAYSVCGRWKEDSGKILVVASAGNTARAFARVCSENKIPLLLCMPEDTIDSMWFDAPVDPCVKLVVTASGSDYFDAIHLSNEVCKLETFVPEGGAKNVARRDGMGTTVLSFTTTTGKIPDYYYQAVGSGTGAIAAWEANLRLLEDGRFGNNKMKLMLSQNVPFLPMYDAWKARSRNLLPLDDQLARQQVVAIDAKVLSNRRPPYAIAGGLFDAMNDCGGDFIQVTNQEARAAAALFLQAEGIDIHPAAAVAVGSLIKSVNEMALPKDACIMLNITGGGEERFKKGKELHFLKPAVVFQIDEPPELISEKVLKLFAA